VEDMRSLRRRCLLRKQGHVRKLLKEIHHCSLRLLHLRDMKDGREQGKEIQDSLLPSLLKRLLRGL